MSSSQIVIRPQGSPPSFWAVVMLTLSGTGFLVTLMTPTCCLFFYEIILTLIEPGEVKVDLADFDLKLQEILLSTYVKKNIYSSRNVFQIFLNFLHDFKKLRFNIHFDIFYQ